MKRTLFTLITLFFASILLAQNFRQIGARQAGMAYAGVATNDVWAYHNNPGMLGFLEEAGVGAHYENRFFLREFQYQGLVYAQPLKKGVVSLGGQYSGFEQFSTSRAGVGYALALSELLSMGIQINYMNVRQPAYYGTKHGITGEFGLGLRVTPKWTMAMAINNITRSKLVEYQNERFETIFRVGANYKVSERVLICSELEKDITFPMRLKAGLEYMPTSVIFIRAGAAVNVTSFALGFGYKIKNLHIDISSNYLQPLGFQTCVSLHYVLQSKVE